MAPVEQQPDTQSGTRHGSVGSRTSNTESPSLIPGWTQGPWAKIVAKAAGISLLMLGLGGIGALAMAQGLAPHSSALGEASARRAPARGGAPSQASLTGGAALSEPRQGAPSASAAPPPEAAPPAAAGFTADGKVILNLASVSDLRKLPGVGQKRAEAILALRQKLGRFKRPTDLLRIRGIGPKRLKQMMEKFVLDPPKEAAAAASSAPAPAAKPETGSHP